MKPKKEKYKFQRSFKKRHECHSFISVYGIVDYEIENTSFEREYQGRLVNSKEYTVYYNA